MEVIPDDALVVRGGRKRPEDIFRGTRTHSSGVTGISVESAAGCSREQLAAAIPHSEIGVTTVGAVPNSRGRRYRDIGKKPQSRDLDGLDAGTGQ